MINKVILKLGRSIRVLLISVLMLIILSACSTVNTPVYGVAALNSNVAVLSNIEYGAEDGKPLLLDVYIQAEKMGRPPWARYNKRRPTLLYIHGGGWGSGDKISRTLLVVPYIMKGWHVVNIDYRFLGEADMQGIIEDCRLALSWINKHADEYNFDTTKIVMSGESAGGHLALSAGFTQNNLSHQQQDGRSEKEASVAAIVNWFGVTDLESHVTNIQDPAVRTLLGADTDFKYTSPVNLLHGQVPPVISIFGDSDQIVSYEKNKRMHTMLDSNNIKNKFITIPGGEHGNFDDEMQGYAFNEIWAFLDSLGIHVETENQQ